MFELNQRVRITEGISGDDTPIGAMGTVSEVQQDGTLCVLLDGEWADTNEYWTDGSNLEAIE